MMLRRLIRNDDGAAVIEMAFALPILIVMIWMVVQIGLVFRATAGIQHALGEGARLATVWPEPSADDIHDRVADSVYGIGPGDFSDPLVEPGTDCDDSCLDVTVEYSQDTDLLLLPGPTITVSRTKRVWTAGGA
ncbi:MAG: TadE/TadG family type IV pilus assembly protein [Sphingomicrobium sp.]